MQLILTVQSVKAVPTESVFDGESWDGSWIWMVSFLMRIQDFRCLKRLYWIDSSVCVLIIHERVRWFGWYKMTGQRLTVHLSKAEKKVKMKMKENGHEN